MRKPREADELLTVSEASKEKGISPDGIRAAIRTGRLPAIKKSERLYLVKRSDLQAWRPRGWRPGDEGRKGGASNGLHLCPA